MERRTNKSIALGFILLTAGMLILSTNFNLLPWSVHQLIFNWRTLLIAIGVVLIFRGGKQVPGLVLIGIGSFFHLQGFLGIDFSVRELLLPALFIFLGVAILFKRHRPVQTKVCHHHLFDCKAPSGDDYIEEIAIFGGGERQIVSRSFCGGKVIAVFGGSTLSFIQSVLAPGPQTLDLLMLFGGTKLIVPSDWRVRIEVISIFGGFSDKRLNIQPSANAEAGELVIKGIALFGGGEIKSY